MKIEKIAVFGAGTMGNGIAHVFALKGYRVYLYDSNTDMLPKAMSIIETNLQKQVKKGIISVSEAENTLNNIEVVKIFSHIPQEVDLVVEAIVEEKNAKHELFEKLQNSVKSESIFASNTSAISITELACSGREEKFIGMHFMNPVPVMNLVEIIRGYSTSEETVSVIKDTVFKLGKTPVEVADYPGFISNRVLMPMINEAIYALYENVASKEDIDTVMKMGMNHPMGPLALADFIGLDVCLAIMNVLFNGFNDDKYRPCPLLKKMVSARKLGRKTGEGFYKY